MIGQLPRPLRRRTAAMGLQHSTDALSKILVPLWPQSLRARRKESFIGGDEAEASFAQKKKKKNFRDTSTNVPRFLKRYLNWTAMPLV